MFEENSQKANNKLDVANDLTKKIAAPGSFFKNVLILVIAQVVVKFIGLIYRIIMVNIQGFGDAGEGFYSAGFDIYIILLTISCIGIPVAISKLVSERIAVGKIREAQNIFRVALIIFGIFGGLCSLFMFFGAPLMATGFLKVPNVELVLKVLAPSIFFVSIASVIKGYFQGLDDMKLTSVSQIIEQIANAVLSIALVVLAIGQEPYIMAAAGTLATTLSVLIGYLYIQAYYIKHRIKPSDFETDKKHRRKRARNKLKFKEFKKYARVILYFTIPITLGALFTSALPLIDTYYISKAGNVLDPQIAENFIVVQKGIMSKVGSLTIVLIAIASAVSVAIIPIISTLIAQGKTKEANNKITNIISLNLLLLIPGVVGCAVLAGPILHAVYPNASQGETVFVIMSVTSIFIALMYIFNGSLQALGNVIAPLVLSIASVIIKFAIMSVMIGKVDLEPSIIGAISTQVAIVFSCVVTYIIIKRTLKIKLDLLTIIKCIVISAIMGVLVHFAYQMLISLHIHRIITLGLAVLFGILVYGILGVATNMIKKDIIYLLPGGEKIWGILIKLRVVKENKRLRS